jgi:hypothetical protein
MVYGLALGMVVAMTQGDPERLPGLSPATAGPQRSERPMCQGWPLRLDANAAALGLHGVRASAGDGRRDDTGGP